MLKSVENSRSEPEGGASPGLAVFVAVGNAKEVSEGLVVGTDLSVGSTITSVGIIVGFVTSVGASAGADCAVGSPASADAQAVSNKLPAASHK